MMEYCTNASPLYLSLLAEQRMTVQRDVPRLVEVSDLAQAIRSRKLGVTYYRELSYGEGFARIADHVNFLKLTLAFYPGN